RTGAHCSTSSIPPRGMTYQLAPDASELRSFGGYSGNLPHKTSPALLAVLSSTSESGPLAARLYAKALAQPSNDLSDGNDGFAAFEMLFAAAPPDDSAVSTLPLS